MSRSRLDTILYLAYVVRIEETKVFLRLIEGFSQIET